MQYHRHQKHMITFPKGIGSNPKPIPENVIPCFKLNGEVGLPTSPYNYYTGSIPLYVYENVNDIESTLWIFQYERAVK